MSWVTAGKCVQNDWPPIVLIPQIILLRQCRSLRDQREIGPFSFCSFFTITPSIFFNLKFAFFFQLRHAELTLSTDLSVNYFSVFLFHFSLLNHSILFLH